MPAISIIMPLFNGAAHLPATLASVRAQTFSDYEVLLVDDGSTDGGPELAAAQADARWKFLRTGKNQGPAVARNAGLAAATGGLIAFWDSDDLAAPERLAVQAQFLSAHPEYALVASRARVMSENSAGAGTLWGYAGDPAQLGPDQLFKNNLSTSSLLLRREALAGRQFDPAFVVASDYEMWARLIPPHQAFVLPQPLVTYRAHAANLTHRKQALLEDTLRRIARAQLQRLDCQPTDAELDVHRFLARNDFAGADNIFAAAEAWLLKLQQANDQVRLYSQEPFRRTLADYWADTCWKAALLGRPTWGRFSNSALKPAAGYAAPVRRRVGWANLKCGLKRWLRRN